MSLDLEILKQEADSLGVKYRDNIGAETLAKKIEDFKAKDLTEPEVEVSETPRQNKRVNSGKPVDPKLAKRREVIQKAMKRSKVIVHNNDPRDREKTTCMSAVRNSVFGNAKIIPLGKEWWLEQIHIDNLKGIDYTSFVKDAQGNSSPKKGKKFTVEILATDEEAEKKRLAAEAKS